MILERALPNWKEKIQAAQDFLDIAEIIKTLFDLAHIPGQEPPKTLEDYKADGSDYGLKVKGIKAREKLNDATREILARVENPEDLKPEDIEVLKQYSGRGGLTENSQFEYYTPQHVAEGCWDSLKANGFPGGNVLDPSTGHGMFPATKLAGAVVTGCDIDATSSKIAQLLHPDDKIDNKSFEKLATDTPDNTFDAVVTNVPFGDARGKSKFDDPAYQEETRLERYFILRSIDKVRPGGLCVFVVPTNIVGARSKQWERWRLAVSKKAEFLGAHKLPSKTFSSQGTDTVVDVVVFKKHPTDLLERVESLAIETLRDTKVVWNEFLEGRYWIGEGRPYIMGKYMPKVEDDRWSRETVDGDVDDAGLKAKLAARFDSRIDWDALGVAEPITRLYASGDRKVMNGVEWEFDGATWNRVMDAKVLVAIDADLYGMASIEELKALLSSLRGALSLTSDQAWNIYKTFPDLMTPLQRDAIRFAMSQPKAELAEQLWRGSIIGGMIGRYDSSMTDGTAEDAERIALQEIITAEIDHFGHPKNNKGLIVTGEAARTFGLFANAVDQKGNFSDLLNGTLDKSGRMLEYDSSNPQAIVEHLFIREGIMTIELEDLKKLYTGSMKLDSLGDIAEIDGIAISPDGTLVPMGRFTCGDIYSKFDALQMAMAGETDKRVLAKWEKQIAGIMQRRRVTQPENISFGFQNKWYSRQYIIEFLHDSGYKNVKYGVLQEVTEEDPVTGKPRTRNTMVEDYENPFGHFYGLDDKGFEGQFKKYLNGGNVTSSKAENIEEYKRKVRALEDQFNAWLKAHPDIDRVAEEFNRKFNGFTPFEYEDNDLGLQGVSDKVKLHGFQNAAVRRLSEEGRGILALDVGLGKTYGALGLYAYNKQMGRSKRTCIVVPKSVLSNWYHETNKFLENMNGVFFVGLETKKDKSGNAVQEPLFNEDGTPKVNASGDQEFQSILQDSNDAQAVFEQMWAIPQSNYSLVIMSNEKFGSIPMKQETRDGYVEKMVARSMLAEKGTEEFRKVSYADSKKSLKKEEEFAGDGTKKKGELPFFEDMGFTDVITDEFHNYKNSARGGEQTAGVAYISNPTVSKRGVDMSMKLAYLKDTQNGRGAYGLTATPLTNSPLEIFNMLLHVAPMEEFESRNIYNVDDFVRQFGDIQQVDKLMMTGELKSKDGLVGFKDLDGLRGLFHKYVNQKSAKDFPDQLKLPEQVDTPQSLPLSGNQEAIYDILKSEAADATSGKKEDRKNARPVFSILRDMEKVATDLDLYYKTMTFTFSQGDKGKVGALIEKLPKSVKVKRIPTVGDENYDDTLEEQKAVEMNIPLKYEERETKDSYTVSFPDAYESLVVVRLSEAGIAEENVAHPLTPKYAKLVENCKAEFELNGKQLIFTEEKTQHEKIVRILVHHIPAMKGAIAIINADEASGDKLQQISDAYNNGTFKFCVCNKKAEVGVNLQKGTTAIHHLTFPWTPASIQQRNGRGVRQGNKAPQVRVYYYQAGFDSYKLELLNRKASWIGDIINGDASKAQNGNIVDQGDIQIMLSNNPEEAKKRIMEQQAEKSRKAKEYADKQSMITLQKLANNISVLANMDGEKEKKRQSLQEKIPDLEKKIARYRDKGITLPEGDEERKKLGKMVGDTQNALDRAKKDLENLDADFKTYKENVEASVKRDRLTLKVRADKEGVPFDKALVDNPEKAAITPTGKMVCIGDMYEVSLSERYSSRSSYTNNYAAIVKISGFSEDRKNLELEVLQGSLGYGKLTPSVSDFLEGYHLVKVSYSEDEIRMKDFLSKEHGYDELISGKISKEIFQAHYAEIKWKGYGQNWLCQSPEGEYAFNSYVPEGAKIAYPDKESETFKKAICEAYLTGKRNGRDYYANGIMKAIFGTGWETAAMEYGKKAAQAEVDAELERLFQAYMDTDFISGTPLKDSGTENILRMVSGWKFTEVFRPVDSMGDNTSEIHEWQYDYQNAIKAKYAAMYKEEQDAAEAKKLQEIKSDPNYKEVPENVRAGFEQVGIVVKTNRTDMVLPGFKGRAGERIAPFQRWFFHDNNGFNGKLYPVKDTIKIRYKAQFFKDAGGEFNGAWWHVSSTVDLSEFFKLIG